MTSITHRPRHSRAASSLTHAATLAALLTLAACGGGGGETPTAPSVKLHALASVSIEPAGTQCTNGGNLINTGIDRNNNGLLDAAEVTSSAYVCNGAPGTNGTNGADGAPGAPGVSTLLQMVSEPAGTHCADGGSRIMAGRDLDGSGVLDAAEVTVTSYVCGGAPGANGADGTDGIDGTNGTNGTNGTDGTNGTNGTDGTNGTNGLNSLMNVTPEPAGANCAAGGVLIESGLDSNGDSVLQPGEVTRSQYVCHGAQGATGPTGATGEAGLSVLIATDAEAAGANCLHGGTRITSGQDANRNSVLDASEISATSYVCNGPGITWVNVTTPAVQGSNNTGYIVDTAVRATVTLPANPAVGDIVRISGAGIGGWQIGQNAGQSISTRAMLPRVGNAWTAHDNAHWWRAVTSSADGDKLAAVDLGGKIYTSTDAGITWTARESDRNWVSITSSADGNKLAAVVQGGQIYTSGDAGVTWSAHGLNLPWSYVASSADGDKLVAVAGVGQIYTSTDAGQNWTARETDRNWFSVASSADGTKLAAVELNGQIYTSTDSGVTWTARDSSRDWLSIASSADGNKLVAGVSSGTLYTSDDAGVTWVSRGGYGSWISVASSADGTRLLAAFSNERLYMSTDSGVTWTPRENSRFWEAVASSADGNKVVAAEQGGRIYTSFGDFTTPGTAGWLRGEQYDAIELQFVGHGLFIPLSYTNGSGSSFTGN